MFSFKFRCFNLPEVALGKIFKTFDLTLFCNIKKLFSEFKFEWCFASFTYFDVTE